MPRRPRPTDPRDPDEDAPEAQPTGNASTPLVEPATTLAAAPADAARPITPELIEDGARKILDEPPPEPPSDPIERLAKWKGPIFTEPVVVVGEVYFRDSVKLGPTAAWSFLPGLKNCPPDDRGGRILLDLRARIFEIRGKHRGSQEEWIALVPMEVVKSFRRLGEQLKG